MALRFYNTLSQQLEEFTPARDNTVRMYTCGPTVYDFAHIGNFRSFTFVDLLRKWLRASGLGLEQPDRLTPDTEHINDMVEAIEKLSAEQHTYASDGSVYFRIATFPGYGK